MAKKVFTDESLGTLISEVKSYVDDAVSKKANTSHSHSISNITNLQSTLDNKAASSHTHTVANITDLTATASEINSLDGIKSNVQTQIDTLTTTVNGKANASHTHNFAGSSSAGGDANNALKLQGYTRSNLYKDLHDWINAVGLTHTIVVEGDKDTYYPVRIYLPSAKTMPTYVSIHKNLGTQTPEIEGNHSNGTSSMWLIYEGRNRSWDGNGGYLKTWYRYMGYANLCAHADIGSSAVGDLIVWLRGGGCLYQVSKTANTAEPAIYYEETNIGTTDYPYMVAPRTDLGNKGIYSGTLGYGNIEGNATTATRATQDSNGNVIASTYETKTNATNKLSEAKTYADNAANKVKNDLLGGAGAAYDTLKELSELITDNQDAIDVLESVASSKANASDLTSHTSNKSNPHGVTMAQLGIGSAGSSLGLVKTGGDVTISSGVITVNDDSHNHTIANIDNLQISLDAKQATITGGATTITGSNLTANRALISNGSGKVAVSAVTSTELGYLDGITSNVQTQLDGKAASSHTHSIANVSGLQSALDGKSSTSHTHSYAGSPSIGGGANSLAVFDTRNVNDTPTEMTNLIGGKGARLDFKSISTVGLSNGTYAAVLSISPWGDTTNWSGGKNTQLGFCDDGRIQVRKGNGGGWTDWNTIIDSSTIGNQSVKYATSAGSSTKATQDASGNVITSTYATKVELDTAKSNLQTSINGKANSSHTHTIANITNLQTTLDGKSSTSHTHKYAGSSSVGGSATSAVKLDTATAGDSNTPVYFTGGKPVACTSLDLNTSGSSASCTGNSATATKLQTARNISLGTGVTGTATSFNGTANITIPVTEIKESYLSWGGKNISGGVSPIDAACSNVHSANRFIFAKPAGITIEYSTNGSTYSTYSTTDSAKVNLVSGIGSAYYIGARSSSTTVNDKLRITLNATNMGLYTRLRKLLINISTNYATGSNVTVERAMKGSESTYVTVGTYQISGWSGWNSIPINYAFGGGDNQTYNIANLRLTFGITGVNSEQTSNALTITDIVGIGDTYWSYPSTMAKTGHIYSYDSSQNTTFPAKVTATTFVGALSGNASTATTASACSGNSATATKLATARTISLTGDVTGSASFDGSANASITATVADDSHNHIISNVDGLQTALDGKSATSHNHNSAYISKDLQFTSDNGGVVISINKDDGKNILTEIGNLPVGFYTVYSQSGTAGNPKTTEAWRFMVHKTGANTGWVQGYGSIGSVYTNYQDGATTGWRGWKCIWDNDPNPLWSGQMYMSSPNSTPQTVTPSKKLSECRTGWLLLWSDYDPGSGSNDADFATTVIPKNNPSGGTWGGKSFLCDIPRYIGSNTDDVDTERRIIKVIYVHDDCIKGSYQGDADERNDVVLRAVYEI